MIQSSLRHLRFITFGIALGLLMVVVGCEGNGCLDNGSAIPMAKFYNAQGAEATIATLTAYGIGAPGDSVLTNNESVSQLYLPLRVNVTATQFVLDYNTDGVDNDTLTFNYVPIRYFASKDCGAMYRFRVETYSFTRHAVDSVAITDSLITNVDKEYIKIFMQ